MHSIFLGELQDATAKPQDMKKQPIQEHAALCLLAWSCLEFTLSEALESLTTIPGEEAGVKKFLRDAGNGTIVQGNLSGTLKRLVFKRVFVCSDLQPKVTSCVSSMHNFPSKGYSSYHRSRGSLLGHSLLAP